MHQNRSYHDAERTSIRLALCANIGIEHTRWRGLLIPRVKAQLMMYRCALCILSIFPLLHLPGCIPPEHSNKNGFKNELKEELEAVDPLDIQTHIEETTEDDNPSPSVFINNFYKRYINVLHEPLLPTQQNNSKATYRFTWIGSFDPTIIIRLEVKPDGIGELYTKVERGTDRAPMRGLNVNSTQLIKTETAADFLQIVKQERFWSLPSSTNNIGLDGASWIIEGLQGNKYHVVDRWSPEQGPVKRIGLYLLHLSGIPHSRIY